MSDKIPKCISFVDSSPSQNRLRRFHKVLILERNGTFSTAPSMNKERSVIDRSRSTAFHQCWELLLAAGFPDQGVQRTICFPGESGSSIIVDWENQKTHLTFPNGVKRSPAWDAVFSFWENMTL